MRKNSPRKWLHACLDLLPVLVIPLFMIYSSNKNYSSTIVIEQQVDRQVDFNQYSRYYEGVRQGVTFTDQIDSVYLTGTQSMLPNYNQFPLIRDINFKRDGSKYYIKIDTDFVGRFGITGYGSRELGVTEFIWSQQNNTDWVANVYVYTSSITTFDNYFNIQVFNLTQMFGVGNEPTIEEFNLLFTAQHYEYTTSQRVVLEDYEQVTYNDTDIGSQMFYTLYNSVDKYFNMGNVFNMNGVYDWFVFNIFGGNFSPALYVVWQVVLYEFVMDLLFLLYGLFMWFIDIVQHLMDKPFKSIK